MVRLVSWNVNGIRACAAKGFRETYDGFDADFFCLQETKASPDQVDLAALFSNPSRTSHVWSSAEKKGYSGTAIFSPHENARLVNFIGLPDYDREGRGNVLFHDKFTLVNLYFPNGAASEERHFFKMGFLENILAYFRELEAKHGPLVICGDYNIAHKPIDIHDPISNKDSSGFLPEERSWMDGLVGAGFVDTYRLVHGDAKDRYSWWSYRQMSRARNKGWRLDYFFVSKSLADKVRKADIHPEIMGSDHCPVSLELQV